MPIRAENSIDCDCGGRYTPKNKSKHMKTKKHRDYEERNKINCLHCGEDTFEGVECENCGENYNQERCYRKGCDICDDTCIHCNEHSEFDKETTECLNCGMYQDIEPAEENEKYLCPRCQRMTSDTEECDNCHYVPALDSE